jgi:hypothetical protein
MLATTFLTSLLATMAAASSRSEGAHHFGKAKDNNNNNNNNNSTKPGLTIELNNHALLSGPAVNTSFPVAINHLKVLPNNTEGSELAFKPNSAVGGIDITAVECHAYKDAEGLVPGSLAFNSTKPALLSTNIVSIGSVLCYVVEKQH